MSCNGERQKRETPEEAAAVTGWKMVVAQSSLRTVAILRSSQVLDLF